MYNHAMYIFFYIPSKNSLLNKDIFKKVFYSKESFFRYPESREFIWLIRLHFDQKGTQNKAPIE